MCVCVCVSACAGHTHIDGSMHHKTELHLIGREGGWTHTICPPSRVGEIHRFELLLFSGNQSGTSCDYVADWSKQAKRCNRYTTTNRNLVPPWLL